MFFRQKRAKGYTYLQIVENRWEEGKTRQRVLGTLGRLDRLQEDGQLEALLESGARFAHSMLVISEHRRGELPRVGTRRIGASMVFDRLWKETGCAEVIETLLAERSFEFPVERAIFLEVLHRLVSPGSDRSCVTWRDSYRIEGIETLELHHAYRAMAWLGETLEEEPAQDALAPRSTKDRIEEALFDRDRDLFSGLELVFFDTTSIYFEGEGGETIGRFGHSKDHRKNRKQMVVGVVLDQEGRPICCELWPGNTTDVKTLLPVAERLSQRFGIGRVCVVADRGMIKKATLTELEERGWDYIVGTRMRNQKEVRDEVLSRGGRYQEVFPPRSSTKDPSPLKVKEVSVDERRYVVCLNEEYAAKDRSDREAIVASLEDRLRQGATSLVGNRGYRRYLSARGEGFEIDEKKIERDRRYDGKWVLRTTTDLPAADVALAYKMLWMVEDIFRTMKSLLETRPVYHRTDAAIRGHVFCSFLALRLRAELEARLAARGESFEWTAVVRDLDRVEEVEVEKDGKRFLLRTDSPGVAGKVFQAAGVALPPTLREVS
ncbi:MAG: IS1634 family transposase [Thermoanaerobaculia bacterium]|nr:IS1634 family transposase [Thermoanaerobaculia bacterium]